MKKIELVIICMLLMLVSCNKEEAINTVSETPKYKTTFDLSNYDQIGENHNTGLDYLLSLNNNPSNEEIFALLNEYFDYQLDNSLYGAFVSENLPQDISSYFNQLEEEGVIKKHAVTQYFIDMYSLINNSEIMDASVRQGILDEIASIENNVMQSDEFDEYEKMWLLGTASVLRHSCEYWSNEEKFNEWNAAKVKRSSKSSLLKDIYIALYGDWGVIIYAVQCDAFEYTESWRLSHSGWTGVSEDYKVKWSQNNAIIASRNAFRE